MRWIDIPPVWLLLFLILARGMRGLVPVDVPGPIGRGLGGILALIGFALMVLAVLEMRKHRTTPIPHQQPSALVSSGVFAWSRNPIYLGDALVLTGAILWWGVLPALVLVPAFIWVITARFILAEEARLQRAFGQSYAAWANRTRRWL